MSADKKECKVLKILSDNVVYTMQEVCPICGSYNPTGEVCPNCLKAHNLYEPKETYCE